MPLQMKSMCVQLGPGDGPKPGGFFSGQPRARSEWGHEREWRIPSPDLAVWGWRFPREAVAFLVFPSREVRNCMLTTSSAWGADHGWVESLPVAYPDDTERTFAGVGPLWVSPSRNSWVARRLVERQPFGQEVHRPTGPCRRDQREAPAVDLSPSSRKARPPLAHAAPTASHQNYNDSLR